MEIIQVGTRDFNERVLKSTVPVMVDFWASWCGPCQMMAPVIEQIAGDHPEIMVAKVNVDENETLALNYGINSIPAILLFKDGKLAADCVGYVTAETLEKRLGL